MPKKNDRSRTPDTALITILDCATTGFYAHSAQILEVCAILVRASDLEVLETNSWVIQHAAAAVAGAPDFHESLIQECTASEHAVPLGKCEGELIAGPYLKADVVCNRGWYFDRPHLDKHFPNASRYIPKREIDINGIETLARAMGVSEYVSDVPRTYRATDDAIAAYEALAHYTFGLRTVGAAGAAVAA
jgi:oligoribonuclease (3'-5' exoribonuclease)